MSLMSNFPGGFANGLSVRGMPLNVTHPGDVYWVSSTSGLNGNPGTYQKPFATIDYAIGKCSADKGDVVMVMPGHTETVTAAGGLALDVAGVAIVGLGSGASRPTVSFTTAVGASMLVTAANCSVSNILFAGGIDALTNPVHVQAADFSMIGCETRDVTGQATDFIVTTAAADRLYIDGWVHRGAAAAGAETALSIVGGDGIVVKNFWIDGNFGTAAIENVTTAATNISIYGDKPCFVRTRNAADVAVTLVATTTGNVGPNIFARLQDNAANVTEAFVGADAQFYQPLHIVNADGEQAIAWNGTASTDA